MQAFQLAPAPVATLTLREIRQRVGVSLARTAELAMVSMQTTRIFEAGGPLAIKSPIKRRALQRVYGTYAEQLEL